MKTALLASLVFALPAAALAASAAVPAGFAPGSLWLSSTSLSAGDAATIYTVAYDSSTESVAGDVVFTIDGQEFGTKHFALAPGTTQIISLPWTATLGSHTFGASMENMNAGSVVLPESKSEAVDITVAAPPPPSAGVAAAQAAASGISSATPVTLTFLSSALGTVQSGRNAAETAIENTLAANTQADSAAAAAAGQVLGTSTVRVATTSDSNWKNLTHAGSASAYLSAASHAILTWMLFVLKNDWLFWIVLALIIYVLLRLFLLMFRERRNRKE